MDVRFKHAAPNVDRSYGYAPYYDDGYYGYGYGPSVGFYFGGGRFGGHRGHWR